MYSQLEAKNFEIIAVAQDTGGEEAAGKYYDKAKATYTTLIDTQHVISSLYHMVNVPMGVWIDEQGRIVRPAEVAYSKKTQLMSIKVDGDHYVAALRDWVDKGDQSKYAMKADELRKRLQPPDASIALAEANFKLGVYFQQQKDLSTADKYWQAAQKLAPNNWNYHRQAWFFTPDKAISNWLKKFGELKGKDYYPKLDLP